MVKVIFHTIRNCSYRKEFAPSGSKLFPLREVPILKRDAIEEKRCLIQKSPFDVCNFFSFLATPLESLIDSVIANFGWFNMNLRGQSG